MTSTSPQPPIVRVALPVPLGRSFDYLGQTGRQYQRGSRVQVPFGQRQLVGLVLEQAEHSEQDPRKLKAVTALLDSEPLLDPQLLQLLEFCARYYQSPLGETISTALPALLRQGQQPQAAAKQLLQLSQEGQGLPEGALAKAKKQAELLALLQQQAQDKTQLKAANIGSPIIKALIDKGLAQWRQQPLATLAPCAQALRQPSLALNDEQQAALDQLRYHQFGCYLIEGTTGSGKTEVYLQAIEACLVAGRQALVLIPEIGLTPQTLARFEQRFNCSVVAIHSGLNDRERLQAWTMARAGQAGVVIGTRSAIFTPMAALGIIIIDEEHDLSFKQQDGVRYSARDLAVYRARQLDIPIVLGTATPALETLHNAINGRYHHLRLTHRAGNAKPPSLSCQDIRQQSLLGGLSADSLSAIGDTLAAGNQVLVFLNRRGYAPSLMCHHCGWVAQCQHCSARMTLHRRQHQLRCHHCEASAREPLQCPACFSRELIGQGYGTERTEQTLGEHFSDHKIIRIDRDTTRGKKAMQNKLAQIEQGQPCILLGTQMLAKGHHFPDVTLVVIVDADGGLFSGDFRGPERMGQLITQVAGRAGRADKPGRVIIQSHHAEHPLLQTLLQQGYHLFARQLLRERQLAQMPPYRHLALLHCDSPKPEAAEHFLQNLRHWLEQAQAPSPALMYLGPFPAPMEKRKRMFRYQLQFNAAERAQLQGLLSQLKAHLEQSKLPAKMRCSLDVDPLDMM